MPVNYNYILELIHQLPKKDVEKLISTLLQEIKENNSGNSLKEIILKAPTWDDDDSNEYKKAREHLNNSRLAS